MREPAFCICQNKGADQLRSNRAADQRLCFCYIESTIPLLPKSRGEWWPSRRVSYSGARGRGFDNYLCGAVVELSFRKGRVHTDSVRALSLPGHMKRSFLLQKGTSILNHLALFSHLHSFTGTICIFFKLKVLKF